MSDLESQDESPENIGIGTVAAEIATDLVGGVSLPAPIKRNLFKAFSRLCSAAVEIPIAYLEGKADERRAETEARVSLVHATASQISQQMRVDPEYARRAASQFGNKLIREQVNLDMIAAQAMEQIRHGEDLNKSESTDTEIDDDWLHNFDTEARKKSAEEMQNYFARILCGEIQKPNSFSIKAVKLLGDMDKKSAERFAKFCSMCMALKDENGDVIDARVLSLGGNAATNALAEYGLDFGQLNFLNEHGLIISDYNSWRDYQHCVGQSVQTSEGSLVLIQFPFTYQGKSWLLVPDSERSYGSALKLHGVSLTGVGVELMKIVDMVSMDDYTQKITAFFQQKKLKMTETVGGPRIKIVGDDRN